MDNVLISVLITAYNRQDYIAEAIESVLASTFQNFELIIVDDCSADNTVAIAKKYEAQNHNIRLYVNDTNLGQFKNRNTAASYAKGAYIKFFDSDDVMHADLLEVTIQAMLAYPEAALGIECPWPKIPEASLPVIFSPREAYINHFFKGNDFLHFGPSSAIMKRKLFFECGGFDEQIGILADTLLMLQMAAKSPVVGYRPNLFLWRRHAGQVTIEQDNYYSMFLQRHEIRSQILNQDYIPLSQQEKRILIQNFKNIFLRNILKYALSIKSLNKLSKMFRLMEIMPIDFWRALKKNKSLSS